MTLDRKVCRQCGGPVTIFEPTVVARRRAERGLDPREYPVDVPLTFFCELHGMLPWSGITHRDPVPREKPIAPSLPPSDPVSEEEEVQGCLWT